MMTSSKRASVLGSAHAILQIHFLTHKLLLENKIPVRILEGAKIRVFCAKLIHSLRHMCGNMGFNYAIKSFNFCRKSASHCITLYLINFNKTTLFKFFCKARCVNFHVYFLRAYSPKISEKLLSFHGNHLC